MDAEKLEELQKQIQQNSRQINDISISIAVLVERNLILVEHIDQILAFYTDKIHHSIDQHECYIIKAEERERIIKSVVFGIIKLIPYFFFGIIGLLALGDKLNADKLISFIHNIFSS